MTRGLAIAVLAAVVGSVTGTCVAVASTLLARRTAVSEEDGLEAVLEHGSPAATDQRDYGFFAPEREQ
jgi:hypothetical protein